MRIGFVGLGVMGRPMAMHLVAAGHAVTGFDLDPAAGEGIPHAADAAGAARGAEVVFTMLPQGHAVAEAVAAMGEALAPGAVLVDCSSAEPWITRATGAALAARGVAMVDAPVSGAEWGAKAAELVFMAGGAEADLARVRPLLDLMGRAVFHVGPLGAGHAMKAINNVVTALTALATTEAMLVGKAHGLTPSAMADVLNVSTGQSFWSAQRLKQDVLNRAFADGFKLSLMTKDVEIANRLAAEAGIPAPLLAEGQAMWRAAAEALGPGAPVTAIVRWQEDLTGQTLEDPE
jgi:3-hydroxyisobutyrate dehydrogenase